MKLVITWSSFLLLLWSTMAFAAGSEEPNLVKFKSGGSVTASYKQYEGDKVTIYLFDPRDGILVVYMKILITPSFLLTYSIPFMMISLDRDFYIRGLHRRSRQFVVPS